MIILNFLAKKIKNSRNQDTIEITIKTKHGIFKASAPEGASKGENEVKSFAKQGIDKSIQFANSVGHRIMRKEHFEEFQDLEKIENIFKEVDKTPRLELTGGNTLFAIEAATLKALARSHQKKELWQFLFDENYTGKPKMPMQLGNCIGGGKHTREIKKPDFQEFLFLPKVNTFKKSFDINQKAYSKVKNLLKKKDKRFKEKVTDEKAFISYLNNEEIFSIFQETQKEMKYSGKTFTFGTDVAASSFYNSKTKKYDYTNLDGAQNCTNFGTPKTRDVFDRKPKNLTEEEHLDYIFSLIKKYKLSYVEDPFHENDFDSFAKLLSRIKKEKLNTLIVGDDLTCTNPDLLKKAILKKSVNALIVKPNQIGSLLEMKRTIDLAKKNNIIPIIAHRSGETNDDTLAHLAVGWQIPIIKIGIRGKERLAKTKKLLDIEKKINKFY